MGLVGAELGVGVGRGFAAPGLFSAPSLCLGCRPGDCVPHTLGALNAPLKQGRRSQGYKLEAQAPGREAEDGAVSKILPRPWGL